MRTPTAERIRGLRLDNGWTQLELARMTDLERKSIIRYENGDNIPNGKALTALARVFEVSADYLLGLSAEPHPVPASESTLTSIELEAVQVLRRARTDEQRQRLLETLKTIIPADAT